MARWLVWACGGLVVVGVLIRLCVVSATHTADQTSAMPGRAPSTPASGFTYTPAPEQVSALRDRILRDGKLAKPEFATESDLKAYGYALEQVNQGKDPVDAATKASFQALQEARRGEQQLKTAEHKRETKERSDRSQAEFKARRADRETERALTLPPEELIKRANRGKPERVSLDAGPPFTEDPANPVPKPPTAQTPAPKK